jgi:hypothetical protein
MAERLNTVVCSFDPSSPRITEYDNHEWLHTTLRIQENTVSMIQIDGIKRQVFIKFVGKESINDLLRDTGGSVEYKYTNGEISIVTIDISVMGTKLVRVSNLPPEVPNVTLLESLTLCGKVLSLHAETWAMIYRYSVSNGVRQVVMHLTRHMPSHLIIAGYRVLLSYEGQPETCYSCVDVGQLYQTCPARRAN